MAGIYFDTRFGDIELQVSSVDTERGRDIAVQSPAYGDKHNLTDRGLRQMRTTVEILFADKPGWAPYLDRYDELVRLCERGEVAIFSHPIDGSFRARCSEVSARAEADELAVRATCVFLREDPPQVVFPVAAGVSTIASSEAVNVAAQLANMALADVDFGGIADPDFGVVDDVATTVTAWEQAGAELDAQQVFLEVATLSDRIDTAIADLELAQDLSRYPAYEAMIRLRYQLSRAAEAFTSEAATVFDLYVEVPQPVLRICADVYGAALAVERAEQVTSMNRIRTPNLVPRGTTLKMPAVS